MFIFPPPGIYQVSAFEALRVGHYDGTYEVRNLVKHGDFGLGTYNGLDGEMVVYMGHMYQIDAFGEARHPQPETETPFAFITYFKPSKSIFVTAPMTLSQLQAEIDKRYKNGFLAIHIHGRFQGLMGRSFAKQQKPYQPFAKTIDCQSMLPYGEVEGDLVGFRMPKSVGSLNVPGYHFHFIASDKRHGGHVLSYAVQNGTVELMPVSGIHQAKLQ